MENTRKKKPARGIDFDVSLAWYKPGGCPLRVWPTFERIEDIGDTGPGNNPAKDIPPT